MITNRIEEPSFKYKLIYYCFKKLTPETESNYNNLCVIKKKAETPRTNANYATSYRLHIKPYLYDYNYNLTIKKLL